MSKGYVSTQQFSSAFKFYNVSNYHQLPQIQNLSASQRHAIEVVGRVLLFKTNSYVVNELIDWNDPYDPIFILNFPQREMLLGEHFSIMERALAVKNQRYMQIVANGIRRELNPHPAGQAELNIPCLKDGTVLHGMQHKYDQTVLFFPSQGQTCHAFCTFCFRWPQFVKIDGLKFAMKEADLLVRYVKEHPEITDVLFTGGDPLVMRAKVIARYIEALLEADIEHLKTIRLGTKVLAYWPYRFLTDPDHEELLEIFRKVRRYGKHLAIMAHFNHPREIQTKAAREAIRAVRNVGAEIRTQSPILRHINDSVAVWAELWQEQVNQGCVPYFMFATRDTGAQHYFAIPLARGWEIFRSAMQRVSGIARTLRGYSMSACAGKIQIVGVSKIQNKKVFVLRLIQGRNSNWTHRPFFAEYDETATWIDDLRPAFGEDRFFYEDELEAMMLKIDRSRELACNSCCDSAVYEMFN